MDDNVIFRGNDCDVVFPKSFTVRKYDNNLNYSLHRVIRYYTANTYTFVYSMMRSSEKVTVRIDSENIVAINDRLTLPKHTHFSHNTPVDKLVCEMLTNEHSLVVPEDTADTLQATLF